MKTVNVIDPRELVGAIFNDYSSEIESFSKYYSSELLEFCEIVSTCHKKHNLFSSIPSPSERALHVSAHIQVVINYIYTSMQLLMIEHVIPSGNMYRQSIEALSMAILLAHPGKIVFEVKKKTKEIDFFDSYKNEKAVARPHTALRHVQNNSVVLKVKADSIEKLKNSKDFLNNLSHPSKLSLALSQSGGNESKWFLGGGIRDLNSNIFKKEIDSRINYINILPSLFEELYRRVETN